MARERRRSDELYPVKFRKEFYCTPCKRLFSIHTLRGETIGATYKPYCPWCGDNVDVQRYNPVKHGFYAGKAFVWTTGQKKKLKNLLEQPLTWPEIAESMGEGISYRGIISFCQRQGWQKKYEFKGGRPKDGVERKIKVTK